MKAVDVKFTGIFTNTPRLEVPLFQRPYVWQQDPNWESLWNDIRRAAEQVEAEWSDVRPHREASTYFLGAVVLQERSFRPNRVRLSFIIDGQQRLTTLQAFLAAAQSIADRCGAPGTSAKFQDHVEVLAKSVDPAFPEDRYRVWPLPQDREAYRWAVRTPGDTTAMPVKDNAIARARQWFEDSLKTWVDETGDATTRLEALHFAVEDRLQFVQIVLEKTDDPQVIFEALNHRGVPLDAADLVKNLLFQTLDQQGNHHAADTLLMEQWLPLDSDVWRTEVTTGRIRRAQVDVLLSYFLTIATGDEVPIERLFAEFKAWIAETKGDARDIITSVRRHADSYLDLKAMPLDSPVGQLVDVLEATQTTTPWPVLLFLRESGVPEDQLDLAATAIASFLMRRNVCDLTTKDYNRLFLQVLNQTLSAPARSAGQAVVNALEQQKADARYWPDDAEFRKALLADDLYRRVVRARLKCLLVGLENYLRTEKSEYQQPLRARDSSLNIEHVLPQQWEKSWALPDASEARLERRRMAVHRLGNLTVTTTKMNPALSNRAWPEKRKGLQSHSLARLTTASILSAPDQVDPDGTWPADWDEDRISQRGAWLANLAVAAWPRLAWSHISASA